MRFIPACAGNASLSLARARCASVHPRVRGERNAKSEYGVKLAGSSPRARGTQWVPVAVIDHPRFIPACAGNARHGMSRGRLRPVHPRVRGERASQAFAASALAGSSPRARGTLETHATKEKPGRFIPACAGNAHKWHDGDTLEPVHPRVRGERMRARRSKSACIGSSPRARGTLSLKQTPTNKPRFIPACAGNARRLPGHDMSVAVHPRVRGERKPGSCSR